METVATFGTMVVTLTGIYWKLRIQIQRLFDSLSQKIDNQANSIRIETAEKYALRTDVTNSLERIENKLDEINNKLYNIPR